jgi:two-component system, cell cycle sensor histidine kinase and response regulator CckA
MIRLEKQPDANGRRILVVEDEEMLRSMIEMVLRAFGYDVLSAASVEEAEISWRENRGEFDLLLTDMVLPNGGTGKQIADRLKAERADLKVVYASGFTSDTLDVENEKLVEGVNFLQKPYTTQTLAETVRQCLAA